MNGVMLQAFQWELPADGMLWEILRRRAWQLARMGFTALWLPPAYKGAGGARDVGYGVYDLYDLGEFDQKGSVRTKYGTRRAYLRAIDAIHRAGMQVLADAVLNHRMGADRREVIEVIPVNPADRRAALGAPLFTEAYTGFDYPGRRGKYSAFRWEAACFTGVDWTAAGEGVYLLQGKQWAQDVDGEKGNFDYLMGADVDVLAPRVRRELEAWGRWYLNTTGVDGFRMDAVKHISAAFCRDWLAAMRRHARREVFAVGEYWHPSVDTLSAYLDATDWQMHLFDVPLHHRFHRIGRGESDLRHLFDGTLTGRYPQMAVTFVDNHDTQPGQSLESFVAAWFKPAAYGLILLRADGYPCVFWGDLYGIPTRRIDPVWSLPTLLRLRRTHARGAEHDYFDQPEIIGFTREAGLAFLCASGDGGSVRMYVGAHLAGRTLRCRLGRRRSVRLDPAGWGEFSVGARGWAVWSL